MFSQGNDSDIEEGENPFRVMETGSINDNDNIFHEDHDKTTYPDIGVNNQMVGDTQIDQYLDENTLTYKLEKVDLGLMGTEKMVQQCQKPSNQFSAQSIIEFDLIRYEDKPESTNSTKKERWIEVVSDEQSESRSFQPSNNSKGTIKKARKTRQSPNVRVPLKEKLIHKKKDERKNASNNCFKFIVKEFISPKYQDTLQELSMQNNIDSERVRQYYQDKLTWNVSLSKLRDLVNFKQPNISQTLKNIKQTFHTFFVFYMRHRYTNHILTEDKIEHKHEYLEAKRYLIYLPDIKPLAKFNKHLSQN